MAGLCAQHYGCSVLIFSVADVDAKERVDNSLVEIMKLKFEEILKLNICQDFKQIFCQSGAEAEFRS